MNNNNWRNKWKKKFRTQYKSQYKSHYKNKYKHIAGVNCEKFGHTKETCRGLKFKKRKFSRFSKRGKRNAILAIAKALNWSGKSEDESETSTETNEDDQETSLSDSSEENNIISEDDDDELTDEANEEAETIAALKKLINNKYKYQSPRRNKRQ